MYLKASLDKLSKILSPSILGFMLITILILRSMNAVDILGPDFILGIVFLGLIIVPLFFYPLGYGFKGHAIYIKFPLRKKTIALADISSLEAIDGAMMKNSFRTFGSGAYFGYWGKFTNSNLGKMTWYATQRKNYVLLKTKEGLKIVLTPDYPESFVQCYHEQMDK